ncbi:60Kd inner membrane protein-domain-containing protein [Mycena galericulata]|nr:60Kd inner membrane protein-domain-containing protein [Mycena galericulata]
MIRQEANLMLAFYNGLRPRRTPRYVCLRQPPSKRFFMQSLCDGFLDLAIALPFPPSVPSYSATIILVTVASRLVLFPVALWGRNNIRRLDEDVLPELERLKPIISREVFNDLKRKGLANKQWTTHKLQQLHTTRTRDKLQVERKRLLVKHNCHPLLSVVASPATQLPVFFIMSVMFNRLARDPTPFDSEAFLSLTALSHPDPTWSMPIILGMVTMANVELNHWFFSAVNKARMDKPAQQAADGKPLIQPRSVLRTALNAFSVLRIILAAFSPGSVVLYWTTSATCGLLQTWIMERIPSTQTVRVTGPDPSTLQPVPAAPKSPASTVTDKPSKKPQKKRPW